ncbi:MAG: hypothetical protein ACR2K9_03180 [Solirubrobacteraceae bacterium]
MRDRIVVLVLVAAASVAGFWFLVFEPKRAEASKLATALSGIRQQEAASQQEIAAGLAARSSYGRDYGTIARLGEAVPADDNGPSLVYQLDSAAKRSGVDFRSLKLSPGTAGSSASTTGTPSATQAASATLPPGAAVGPAGFPTMPFELGFDGSFFHMSDFFRRLDAFVDVNSNSKRVAVSGRLLTINGISLTASRHGFPAVKATVSANAYLVPAAQGSTGGATPSAPSATVGKPAASPSTGASPAPATATPINR